MSTAHRFVIRFKVKKIGRLETRFTFYLDLEPKRTAS